MADNFAHNGENISLNIDSEINARLYEFYYSPENFVQNRSSTNAHDVRDPLSIPSISIFITSIQSFQEKQNEGADNQNIKLTQELNVTVPKIISKPIDFFNYASIKQDQEYTSINSRNADPPCIPQGLEKVDAFEIFERTENYILLEPIRISKLYNIWKEPELVTPFSYGVYSNSSYESLPDFHTDSPCDGFETKIIFSVVASAGQYHIVTSPTPKTELSSLSSASAPITTKYLQCSQCQTRIPLSKLPLAEQHNSITLTAEMLDKLLPLHDIACSTRQTVGRLGIDDTVGFAVEEVAANTATSDPQPIAGIQNILFAFFIHI